MAKVTDWKASYYSYTRRAWVYGCLSVLPKFLRFTEDGEESEQIDFRVYFDEFLELKKETTSIFYAAITVRTKAEKYWFSSLPSRTTVFNVLEHFWKEALFVQDTSQRSISPGGQELLKILHDSANALSSSAKVIERQGEQIDGACRTMNKLHNDLDVADTIIHNLDSWVNQWNVDTPQIYIDTPNVPEDFGKIELPILYASNQNSKHLTGSVVLSCQQLEVLDAERNSVNIFALRDITEVTVHTPWEMSVIKTSIGQPDACVHLMSARLLHLLGTLEPMIPQKLYFEDPPQGTASICRDAKGQDDDFSRNLKLDELDKASKSSKGLKTVSQTEAAEMSQILQDMKSMAFGIQKEQNRQLGKLDELSDSVDKANERVNKDTRHVNRLM